MNHEKRNGFFTSSQAHRTADGATLEKPTEKFKTYVAEKVAEIALGRSSRTEVNVRATKWGKLMEVVILDHLGLQYKPTHEQTIAHPTIPRFSGTPDLLAPNKHGEVKCYEPKKFGLLSLCLLQENIGLLKSDFKEEYWQCVSNCLLIGVPNAELIAFMPRRSQLVEILKEIEDSNFLERHGMDPTDYYFMRIDNIESLPYLPDDSPLEPLNSFEFVVPQEDKDWLEARIRMGAKLVDEYKFPKTLKL